MSRRHPLPQPLAWPTNRPIADAISTGLVAAQIGADVVANWRSPNRAAALECEAVRTGLMIGVAEFVKVVVHRTRPDGSDRKSFFSEHTGLATVSSGWSVRFGVPIAALVGYGRMAADRHYASDVGTGAAVGFALRAVCGGAR